MKTPRSQRSVAVAVLLLVALAQFGCSLDRDGLRPETACNVQQLEYDVDPVDHAYRFSGSCTIEDTSLGYEVEAAWSKAGGGGAAILIVTIGDQSFEADISAKCSDGDPMLDPVNCTDRSIAGSLLHSPFWTYYASTFAGNLFPSFLPEATKAAIRTEAEWPQTAPILVLPTPDFVYHDQENVPIVIRLPYEKGDIKDWQIRFRFRRWDGYEIFYDCEKHYQNSGGYYVGLKTLQLEGWKKYRIVSVGATYKGAWDTGNHNVDVEFHVKGTGPAPLGAGGDIPESQKKTGASGFTTPAAMVFPSARTDIPQALRRKGLLVPLPSSAGGIATPLAAGGKAAASELEPVTPVRPAGLPASGVSPVAGIAPQHVAVPKALAEKRNLVIESLEYKPVPPAVGKPVDLIITFRNKGLAPSDPELRYVLTALVKEGGPTSPVAPGTRALDIAIEAGKPHKMTLRGAAPATAGSYEIAVKMEGAPDASAKTVLINVQIPKRMPVQTAPAPKTTGEGSDRPPATKLKIK